MTYALRISIWPFLLLAGCLLALCLLAPRAWLNLARQADAERNARPSQETTAVVSNETDPADRDPLEAALLFDATFEPPELIEFMPAPREVETAPPVAANVELSPPPTERVAPRATPTTEPSPPLQEPTPPEQTDTSSPSDLAQPAAPESTPRTKEAPQFVPARGGCWPHPQTLVAELRDLSKESETRDWSLTALDELEALGRIVSFAAPESQERFERLTRLLEDAEALDGRIASLDLRCRLRRAVYDLVKRLQTWETVYQIAVQGEPHRRAGDNDEQMRQALTEVEQQLRPLHDAAAWRSFLLLDELRPIVEGRPSDYRRDQLASVLLARLESPQLTDLQIRFLSSPEFQTWILQLRHWASQPVDLAELLAAIEASESGGDDSDVARFTRMLRWSPYDDLQKLGDLVDAHWRNANVRVAVSDILINRMLPAPPPGRVEPVRDQIRGAMVHGWGESRTEGLIVRLLPDRSRIRLGLEARGLIASETSAASGPVRIFNEGLARFRVRKLFTVDRRGVTTFEAEGEADSDNIMTGLETQYDGYPLVGALVRSIAMQQAEQESSSAKWEVDAKLAARASRRLDESVEQELMQAERKFQERVLLPLRRLDLDPEPLEMQTTAQRLIVRYRLAGEDQLAANTPRPQAPGSSLLSVQLHQSCVNNAIEKLKLAGRRVELETLFHELAAALGRPDAEIPDDLPENITVEFARRDPVHVEFVDGAAELTLRFAEITNGAGAKWTNFSVRALYYPEVNGLDAKLARQKDDIIYLDSLNPDRPLAMGQRIGLRVVFTKVLHNRHKLPLVPAAVQNDTRLRDLRVSQLVIGDGWLGAALGAAPARLQFGDRGPGALQR